jgi:hypothetical protein
MDSINTHEYSGKFGEDAIERYSSNGDYCVG